MKTSQKIISKPYLIVLINIILEILITALQLYVLNSQASRSFVYIEATFCGIAILYLVLSVAWIFVLNRKLFFSKLQIIKGIQAAIMISNGAVLLIYLLQDTIAKKCFVAEMLDNWACKEFEMRILIGFIAILDGFIYLARRPVLPEFIVEMEPEDSHFHRRYLGDGQDYLKELKRNSRGSVILDPEGRGMYASYPQLDDYIVKVDVLPEFPNPNIFAPDVSNTENDLLEISNLDVTTSSKSSNRNSFYLNQEYFLPNLPKRSSKMDGDDLDKKYSTLTRDFAKI